MPKTWSKNVHIENYPYPLESFEPDFHATITVSLGELYKEGWIDFDDESWHWDAYNDEQYARMNHKIIARFWYREIGILPPLRWKHEFLRLMNEIMPKYKLLYKRIDEGLDILQDADEYYKGRDVNSAYPQTMIKGDEDYAASGKDEEHERITDGPILEKLDEFNRMYKDVDVMILDDLEPLFSSLYSVNVNAAF